MQQPVLAYSQSFHSQLSRRERKLLKKQAKLHNQNNHSLQLKPVVPKTKNQVRVCNEFNKGQNLLCHGVAGTGKTFLSIGLALKAIMDQEYNRLTIIRSVVPTRDMGFLPGNQAQKSKVYEGPYFSICNELFGRGDAYDVVKNKNFVEFMSTSYVRGTTLSDCVVIVDECQNLTFHELDSVITRAGHNCRIVFCGDFRQTDLLRENEKRGIMDFINVVGNMRSFDLIEFNEEDIVRSELVKEYILSKLKNGIHT